MLRAKDAPTPPGPISDANWSCMESRASILASVFSQLCADRISGLGKFEIVIERSRYDYGKLPETVLNGELPDNTVSVSILYTGKTEEHKKLWVTRDLREISALYLLVVYIPLTNNKCRMRFVRKEDLLRNRDIDADGFAACLQAAIDYIIRFRSYEL